MARSTSTSTYCGVLFCDNEQHLKAINCIKVYYDHFIIKHVGEESDDVELFRTDDDGNMVEGTGINTKKKDHWHFVLIFPYSVRKDYICHNLGIEPNYIQNCSNRKSYLRYLTHYGDRMKTQYTIDNFITNKEVVLKSDLQGLKTKEEILLEMKSIIQNKNCDCSTFDKFIFSLIELGFADDVRRYGMFMKDIFISITGKPVYYFSTEPKILYNLVTGEVV